MLDRSEVFPFLQRRQLVSLRSQGNDLLPKVLTLAIRSSLKRWVFLWGLRKIVVIRVKKSKIFGNYYHSRSSMQLIIICDLLYGSQTIDEKQRLMYKSMGPLSIGEYELRGVFEDTWYVTARNFMFHKRSWAANSPYIGVLNSQPCPDPVEVKMF